MTQIPDTKPRTRRIRYQSGIDAEDTLAKVRRLSETALFAPARVLHCLPLRPFCTPAAPPAWQYRRDWLIGLRTPHSELRT